MTQRAARLDRKGRRGNAGFTLVEVLIVLAILGMLAGVVITSISGMFRHGGDQAYATDQDTIQSAVLLFYFDAHACDTEPLSDAWDSSRSPVSGHYYPTSTGLATEKTIEEILAEANAAGSTYSFPGEAIWMGLLCDSPSPASSHSLSGAVPQLGENGPYLNEVPASAGSNNYAGAIGSYTWVIARAAVVHGVYWDGSAWQAGSSGSYP